MPGKSTREDGWNWQIIAAVAGALVAIGTLGWTVWKDIHNTTAIIQQRVIRLSPDLVLAIVKADQNILHILEEHQLGKPLFAGDNLTQNVIKTFDPSVIVSSGQTVGQTSFLTLRNIGQTAISEIQITGGNVSVKQALLTPGETLLFCIAVKYLNGHEVKQDVALLSYRKGGDAVQTMVVNIPLEYATIPGLPGGSLGAPPTQRP